MNRQQPGYAAHHGYAHPGYARQPSRPHPGYAPQQPHPQPGYVPQQRHAHPSYAPPHVQGQPVYGHPQAYAAQPVPQQGHDVGRGKPRELDALLAGGSVGSNRGRNFLAFGGLMVLVLALIVTLGGVFLLATA